MCLGKLSPVRAPPALRERHHSDRAVSVRRRQCRSGSFRTSAVRARRWLHPYGFGTRAVDANNPHALGSALEGIPYDIPGNDPENPHDLANCRQRWGLHPELANLTGKRDPAEAVVGRARTRIHLSKLGHELLRPKPDGRGLVAHGARDVRNEGVAVVDSRVPDRRAFL